MAIPLHLAMTATETFTDPLPEKIAYMACHFSSYGLGISNLPTRLPAGNMLILNDRIPIWNHEPAVVARQLAETVEEFSCGWVLLDFQRPNEPAAAAVAAEVLKALPCPVGISHCYAAEFDCPVFLPPPPPDMPLGRHIAAWAEREIWLEAALETLRITVDRSGAVTEFLPQQLPAEPFHRDEGCCCRYHAEISDDKVTFTLSRGKEDLTDLLNRAEDLGITRAIGLYQQLGK